jgi:hypothetical protein
LVTRQIIVWRGNVKNRGYFSQSFQWKSCHSCCPIWVEWGYVVLLRDRTSQTIQSVPTSSIMQLSQQAFALIVLWSEFFLTWVCILTWNSYW